MKNMEVIKVANEIHRQILCGVGVNVFCSWAVYKEGAAVINGNPALYLEVSGLLHQGAVTVELTAADDYTIRLYKGKKEHKRVNGVYCDNLGTILDSLIEKDPSISDEEYYKMAMADSDRKLSREAIEVG